MAALANPDRGARLLAARSLSLSAIRDGFPALTDRPERIARLRRDLDALIEVAVRRGEAREVRLILIGLLRLAPLRALARDAAQPLASVLEDEADDLSVRCEVASVLAQVGPEGRFLASLEAASRSRAAEVRQVVYRALGRLEIEPSRLLPLVEQGRCDPSPPVRLVALELAGRLALRGEPRAIRTLRDAFHDGGREQRMAAAQRLGELGPAAPREVVADLTGTLARERDPLLRVATASSLLRMTGAATRYVPVLADGLRSPSSRVWFAAAGALTAVGERPGPDGTDVRVPPLTAILSDPDGDVRTRAAVVLSSITRRPDDYRSWIEAGLQSRDGPTRSFASSRLRIDAGASPLFAVGLPSTRTRRLLAAGFLGVLVFVWWEMRRFSRRAGRPSRVAVVLAIPRRIALQRRSDLVWSDEAAIRRHVEVLKGLGFLDAGSFAIEPRGQPAAPERFDRPQPRSHGREAMPATRLWCLVHPEDAVVAKLVDDAEQGIFLDLGTEYPDGKSYQLTTLARLFRPDEPPGRQVVAVAFEGPLDAEALYRRLLAERPGGPFRSIGVEEFPASYEQAHADYADWRNSQGGMSIDEIRALNEARGIVLNGATLDALRANLQRRALLALDLSLREACIDRAGLSGPEREWFAARLVIVHDHLPVVGLDDLCEARSVEPSSPECLSPRQSFSAYNMRLDGPSRYLRIGTLDRPVAADLYLAPGFRDDSRNGA